MQVIGFNLFDSDSNKIDMKLFDEKWDEILDRLEVQLFKSRYDAASPRERELLRQMSESPSLAYNALELKKIMSMSNKQISFTFGQLVKKNCALKISLGNFRLFHPLFGEYVKKRYDSEK